MNFHVFVKRVFFAVLVGLCWSNDVFAVLRIVATTPDLADLTRRVGGEHVVVDSLTKGTEDIHAVPQRPSFVTLLNRADAVVHLGMGAEHTFLPALLEAASNPNLLPGSKGDIVCSRYIKPMEIPSVIDRAEGEQHPEGNPHYNIDPRNGPHIVRVLAEKLSQLDPDHAVVFKNNQDVFSKEWTPRLEKWKEQTEKTKGISVISQHRDMVYLADFLGMEIVGEVEPKPGIAPTPKHLTRLVSTMKEKGVRLILNEIHYSDKTSHWLSQQTGATVVKVATMGGGFPDSSTYIGMIDRNISNILEGLK